MKLKVIKSYREKRTDKFHAVNTIVEVNENRANELLKAKVCKKIKKEPK